MDILHLRQLKAYRKPFINLICLAGLMLISWKALQLHRRCKALRDELDQGRDLRTLTQAHRRLQHRRQRDQEALDKLRFLLGEGGSLVDKAHDSMQSPAYLDAKSQITRALPNIWAHLDAMTQTALTELISSFNQEGLSWALFEDPQQPFHSVGIQIEGALDQLQQAFDLCSGLNQPWYLTQVLWANPENAACMPQGEQEAAFRVTQPSRQLKPDLVEPIAAPRLPYLREAHSSEVPTSFSFLSIQRKASSRPSYLLKSLEEEVFFRDPMAMDPIATYQARPCMELWLHCGSSGPDTAV